MKRTVMVINDIFQFFTYRFAEYAKYSVWLKVILFPWILIVSSIMFFIIVIAFLILFTANMVRYTYCDYCCGFYRIDQMIVTSHGTDRCIPCHKVIWEDKEDDDE